MTPQSLTAEEARLVQALRLLASGHLRSPAPPILTNAADLITRQAEEIERLRELLARSQYLFAHGVGAMTDNGDRANQERNIRAGGELMLEITKALIARPAPESTAVSA